MRTVYTGLCAVMREYEAQRGPILPGKRGGLCADRPLRTVGERGIHAAHTALPGPWVEGECGTYSPLKTVGGGGIPVHTDPGTMVVIQPLGI